MTDGREIEERIGHAIDLVLDAGNCGLEPSTIVDLSGDAPQLLRAGKGDPTAVSMTGTEQPRRIIAGVSAAICAGCAWTVTWTSHSFLTTISIAAIPVVFAITVHEVAHGWVAKHFGDRTAETLGPAEPQPDPPRRPDRHRCWCPASCCCPAAVSCLAGRSPFRSIARNMRNPRGNMVWVSAAGPPSNIVMAIIWAFLMMRRQRLRELGTSRANGSRAWRSTASSSTSCSRSSTCCRFRRSMAARC